MKQLILILPLLALISAQAFALDDGQIITEKLILGVSPASTQACIRPGEYDTLKFVITENHPIPLNITVSLLDSAWLTADKNVELLNAHDFLVNVSVPEGTAEGQYAKRMMLCKAPEEGDNTTTSAQVCLIPTINVNVSSGCEIKKPVESPTCDNCPVYYAAAAAIIAIAAAALWKVSKIKRGGRRKHF